MAVIKRGGHLVQLGVQSDGPCRGDGTSASETYKEMVLRVEVRPTAFNQRRKITGADFRFIAVAHPS